MGRKNIKRRDFAALDKVWHGQHDEIQFYQFQQYLFFLSMEKLHAYAAQAGIQIIGDIPIYVALDSADAWAEPQLFQFDEELNPVAVAGCPPDAFFCDRTVMGQSVVPLGVSSPDRLCVVDSENRTVSELV